MSANLAAALVPTASRAAARRRLLVLDGAVSGASGAVLLAGATALDGPLGASTALLVGLGAFFLPYAASLAVLVRLGSPVIPVRLVGVGNLSWCVLGIVLVATDALGLATPGDAFGVAQALVVGVLGALQLRAAR